MKDYDAAPHCLKHAACHLFYDLRIDNLTINLGHVFFKHHLLMFMTKKQNRKVHNDFMLSSAVH